MLHLGRFIAIASSVLVLVLGAGCGQSHGPIFEPEKAGMKQDDLKEVRKEIAQLAYGKDPKDIAGCAAYSEAMSKLTARGSAVEPQLIEAVNGSDDWSVRMGAIEVLDSVGTRACIDTLIGALDDRQPLVALYANKLLEQLCQHRVIPTAGETAPAASLPPIPHPDPQDLASDADERQWAAWHRQHHRELQQAWREWWGENKGKVKVD